MVGSSVVYTSCRPSSCTRPASFLHHPADQAHLGDQPGLLPDGSGDGNSSHLKGCGERCVGAEMFATVARWAEKKGKPKMAPIELTTTAEQAQSITRTIFDVVKEHGPLTISDVWEHVTDVGLRGLTSKRQMKIMLRWMREKQKLRLISDHDGPHKQFLYTTWFTNPKNAPQRPKRELNRESLVAAWTRRRKRCMRWCCGRPRMVEHV
ncbi:uncharacterized protein LOC119326342 [Triticum dicoccoides]|uniref:uncharacterized protein LOC119326342 n=1 Tax=Triticum dicoccoides TaxID=85692 RepID=UPI000E7CAC5E|nr:uncharacterized protein LOC119326342 [Triticum dicoccoides]